MKKIFTSIMLASAAVSAMAAINTLNYQALVRDAEGKPAANTEIGVRFRIVTPYANVYEESALVKTDAAGIITYEIGSQDPDKFAEVDWDVNKAELEVSYDLNGGTEYTSTLTSAVSSVPTSLYSLSSADTKVLRNDMNAAFANQANLNENYQNAFNELYTKDADFANIIENITNYLTEVRTALESQANRNENYENGLQEGSVKLADIDNILENITNYLTEVRETLADQANMNENYQNAFNEINTQLADQANRNENYENAFNEINTKVADIENVLENLVIVVKELTAKVGE